MDEAGGCCGLLVIVVLIVLGVVVWRGMRSEPEPASVPIADREERIEQAPPVEAEAGPPEQERPFHPIVGWSFTPGAVLILLGVLYGLGLFLIRPAAQRAKRDGASNQQAALTALTLFAMSPVVVPVKGVWYGLGALGEALTRNPNDTSKPHKPRGLDDLD
ncbi:hypothetical protein [Tautonia marina]|uniref:hypothetical protein n=1 Tax=Tautonia marina TaxID=2653855 RepID=UPI00126060BC|nr:hypothetical protein [Tautonia marina]